MNLSKNKELVSIILVNWNGKKWFEKCLGTLSDQTYKNTEIILVDNASSDGSVDYISKYFPNIKIIKNKLNKGFPTANNMGVKQSKGKYLLLVNTDTWVEKDFVSRLIDFYKRNDYSVISPRDLKYDGSKEFNSTPTVDFTGSPAFFYFGKNKDKLFFTSVSYFCSKKEYEESLGFDENYFAYYEDVDWFWRMSLLNKKFDYVDNIFIYHAGAGSTGGGIKYKVFLWRNQNALQTLIKNYSLGTLLIILPIYVVQNLFEIVFFLLILKFDIAYSYVQGWWFNVKNIRKILKKRKWIQSKRKISDREIMKKMYWGSAKLMMLVNYIR